MQTQMNHHLTPPDVDVETLVRWCQGLGLPFGSQDGGEPFLWIIGTLPVGADEARMRRHLADRAAALLNERPDEIPIGRRPDMLLYNLLKLCAELNCPDELADPLQRMFRSEKLRNSNYLGVPLWDILLHALAYNQLDNTLENHWRAILEEPGDTPRYSGFAGSAMMPRSQETRGEPYVDAIGYALKWMAVDFEHHRNRRDRFRGLLTEVKSTYITWSSFDKDMVYQATQHNWSRWSVESLLNLLLLDQGDQAILWAPVGECVLRSYPLERKRDLCQGLVWEVLVNGARGYLKQVGSIVERHRIEEKKPSDRAMVGALNEALIEVEEKLPAYARAIGEVRECLLERGHALLS